MRITKEILIEYEDRREEIKHLEAKIEQMEGKTKTTVKDTVKGSAKNYPYQESHFVIEGEDQGLKTRLLLNKAQLEVWRDELIELQNKAEEFIESIDRSEIRLMFRLYYLEGMTWNQVAHRMNNMFPKRGYTEDSCRMKNNRFFEKNS